MKILVLNGSPRKGNSNTMNVTNAFVKGLNSKNDNTVEVINVIEKDIKPCRGCFTCWTKTPGKCAINDEMNELREKYVEADVIIWSFPLYYFGLPSQLKAFMDRLLPLCMPKIEIRKDGLNGHPSRYNLENQKYVVISTCGFAKIDDNYDAVISEFNKIYNKNYEKIICPQGGIFEQPYLNDRKDEYLSSVTKAGQEYCVNYSISEETRNKLNELLMDDKQYVEMANISLGVKEDNKNDGIEKNKSDHNEECYKLMKAMSVIYNKDVYKKDIVLEMYFTDIEEKYQLIMKKDECILKESDFEDYTTRVEVTFDLWNKISCGKENGVKAFLSRKYKIKGDYSIMMKMDKFFK